MLGTGLTRGWLGASLLIGFLVIAHLDRAVTAGPAAADGVSSEVDRTYRAALSAAVSTGSVAPSPGAAAGAAAITDVPPLAPESEIRLDNGAPLSPFTTSYWLGYIRDGARLVTSPVHFDTRDWLTAGAVVATFGTLFAFDNQIRHFAQNHRSSTTNRISSWVKPLGNGFLVGPALAGGYLIGKVTDSPRLQQASLVSIESLALAGTIVEIGKFAFHRDRPSQSASAYRFGGPSLKNDGHLSLPSGDTVIAWSVASAMSHEYPDRFWVAPVAYGVATLVGLERINENVHFASDVFLGAAIGYFTGAFLARLHPPTDGNFSIQAMAVDRGSGIEGVYRF